MKYYRLRFDGHVVFKAKDRPSSVEFDDIKLSDYGHSIGVWTGDELLEEITKDEFVEEVADMGGEPADFFDDTE